MRFRVRKKAVARHFAKAVSDAKTDVEPSEETAETAVMLASSVLGRKLRTRCDLRLMGCRCTNA